MKLPHNHGNGEKELMLPDGERLEKTAKSFAMLGDVSRLRIFWLLCHCRECVINISAMVNMTSPAVSHHLRQLKDAGLIESVREGKEVYYRAAQTECTEALHRMLEQMMEIVCPEK